MIRQTAEVRAMREALRRSCDQLDEYQWVEKEANPQEESPFLHVVMPDWCFDFLAGWTWHSLEMTVDDARALCEGSEHERKRAEAAFRGGWEARARWVAG